MNELPRSQTRLIERFADHLRLERRLSPNTVMAYSRDLRQLAIFLNRGGTGLEGATQPLLRRFLAQQHTLGYARASVARRVGAIHTFFRWAAHNGVVTHDPAELLGRPKVVNRLPTVLRQREAAALAEAPAALHSSWHGSPLEVAIALRDRAVLELLYGSGLRVGEVAGLTLDSVDLDRGRVLVLGKGQKEREVPMSDYSIRATEVYVAQGRGMLAGE
ncbi:MAG: site-specific integrase, partial [Actinomycetota bacterium]